MLRLVYDPRASLYKEQNNYCSNKNNYSVEKIYEINNIHMLFGKLNQKLKLYLENCLYDDTSFIDYIKTHDELYNKKDLVETIIKKYKNKITSFDISFFELKNVFINCSVFEIQYLLDYLLFVFN